MSPRIATALLGILFATLTADAATRVDLVIDEPYTTRDVIWPVTTGIPFPRGALTRVEHCRLIDDLGMEQPLQARIAATWDAQGTSIRWLTIDFLATPGRRYTIEYGENVIAAPSRTDLHAIARDAEVRIDTGPLTIHFSTQGGSALQTVHLDLDRNGTAEADELVMVGPGDGEHYYLDQSKERASSASTDNSRQIVLESAGRVRACVRVDGAYVRPDGKPIVRYRTRYHFFAGLSLIKIINEFRVVGSTRGMKFREIGLRLAWPDSTRHRSIVVDADGREDNQLTTIQWRDETRSVTSFQGTFRHFGNQQSYAGVAERDSAGEQIISRSDRVGEWLQVRSDRVNVTGSLRWMWQQFPKAWQATPAHLTLHLWSPRGGELDFGADGIRKFLGAAGRDYLLQWRKQQRQPLNPVSRFFYYAGQDALDRGDVDGIGINKHHEIWLHFAAADDVTTGQEYGRLVAKQPLALATPEWNCASDVFGPLIPRPSRQTPPHDGFDGAKYEAIVDRIFDLGRYAQDTFGDYGWNVFGSGPHYSYQWDKEKQRHYADPRRFEYHTYQKETQLWWCYLRSGERKFLDWAIPSEDHWIDIATTHVPLTYRSSWRGGVRKEQTLHFRPGDWSVDSPFYHVRQRDSAEAWLRGGSQFWASYHRTLETTTLAYYLTGDERYNDVLGFWLKYWRDFAGMTSSSTDVPLWIREQPWFVSTEAGKPAKSWAAMIRDYSPFTSGLRHQMTQLFNLATLYEHTWDPVIGQALRECAEVYLEPENRIGVWRTQENEPPPFAEAPKLAHFWVPALWKYARVTQDPRMDQVFRKYFDACLMADPFRENVGRYSNVHIGYAYYSTRDPRHLRPALDELDSLLPFGTPLKSPEELGLRLYNPHIPIQCLTAIPRLLWALDTAQHDGVSVPPPAPVKLQRAPIALFKPADHALVVRLWGYDKELRLFGPTGTPLRNLDLATEKHASDLQPFDRILPKFAVFAHTLTLPREAAEGYYVLAPQLELAVLAVEPRDAEHPALVNAVEPVALDANEGFQIRVPRGTTSISVESAAPGAFNVFDPMGSSLKTSAQGNRLTIQVNSDADDVQSVTLHNTATESRNWLRLVTLSPADCWGSLAGRIEAVPTAQATQSVLPRRPTVDLSQFYGAGRFGRAAQIIPGRRFEFPDHVDVDGVEAKLFNLEQGTIEFFVKKLWDDRLVQTEAVEYLTNGLVRAWCPRPLPTREWAHVAVEWRPLRRDPSRQIVHIYVDGLDLAYYRSTWWKGYTQPFTFRKGAWLRKFVLATQPGAPYLIDDLRISTVPRYARLDVTFGREQTFNPAHFLPPAQPFEIDEYTAALFHFDGDTTGASAHTESRTLIGTLRDSE